MHDCRVWETRENTCLTTAWKRGKKYEYSYKCSEHQKLLDLIKLLNYTWAFTELQPNITCTGASFQTGNFEGLLMGSNIFAEMFLSKSWETDSILCYFSSSSMHQTPFTHRAFHTCSTKMGSAAARLFIITIVLFCKEKAEGIFSHF